MLGIYARHNDIIIYCDNDLPCTAVKQPRQTGPADREIPAGLAKKAILRDMGRGNHTFHSGISDGHWGKR